MICNVKVKKKKAKITSSQKIIEYTECSSWDYIYIYIWTMDINLGSSVAEKLTRVAEVLAGFDSHEVQPWVFHVFICSFLFSCYSTGTQRLKQWDLNVVGLIISSQSLAYTLSKFGCGILGDFVSPRILLCVGLACTGLTAIIFTGLLFHHFCHNM